MSDIKFKQSLLLWKIPGNMLVVRGFVYSRDNKDKVKKNAGTMDPFTDTMWHCYPVSYTKEQGMVLSNMDPELNPCPFLYSSESLMSNVIFYFVTHNDIEKEFGLDVDGDYLRVILRPENYESKEFSSILEAIGNE